MESEIEKMKLEIEKLGPLGKNSIEFGDLTLLMGPPNTGKSYTLKALYLKLFPLDSFTLSDFKEKYSMRLRDQLEESFSKELLDILREFLSASIEVTLKILLLSNNSDLRNNLENLLKKEAEKKNFEYKLELNEDKILVSIKSTPIKLKLTIDFDKNLGETVRRFASDLVGTDNIDTVILYPADISNIKAYQIISIPGFNINGEDRIPISLILDEILMDFFELLNEKYKQVRPELKESINVLFHLMHRYLRRFLKYIRIHVETSKISQNKLELIITFSLRINISTLTRETLPKEVAERFTDELLETTIKEKYFQTSLGRATNIVKELLSHKLTTDISEGLYKALRKWLGSRTDYNDLRYIPFGRTTVLLEIERASRDPFTRGEYLRKFSEFHPIILRSHAYWTSRGRGLLFDPNLEEWKKKLLRIVTPLIEGALTPDPAGKLMYKDWRGVNVDVDVASALVDEVSGILLPLLTVKEKSLILIEEPEAQLHPGAQIIMALFIASLMELCKCKVVVSTHSDLFAITIAQLVEQKPDKKWIIELIKGLVPHVNDGVEDLATIVAESIGNLDVKVYEYTREGSVNFVEAKTLLSERVPSITEVIDTLTDWAFRLAAHRASEGKEKNAQS